MKAVPTKAMALILSMMFCSVTPFLLGSQPTRAAAESLQVTTRAESDDAGLIDLRIAWHWGPTPGKRVWGAGEELLAVSFDTRTLVWLEDQASHERGADGDALRRLEEYAGPDGARRLYVIPEGQDGAVRLKFRPKEPGAAPSGEPFKVYVVFDSSAADVWMAETALPAAGQVAHY